MSCPLRGLTKRFDGPVLFQNVDFDIKRGERIAIIGNNGTGKTTILKIINGLVEQDAGETYLWKIDTRVGSGSDYSNSIASKEEKTAGV